MSVASREWRCLIFAVQCLTRIPTPALAELDAQMLERSAKYFPLVGIVVGMVSAMALVASAVVLPQPLPGLVALVVGVLVTGAFHEDGLADSCDGLFGGSTPDRRLEIMKDSRIGTFGVLGLICVIGLKAAALTAFDPRSAAMVVIAMHATSRLVPVVVMAAMDYVGRTESSKIAPAETRVTLGEVVFAAGIAALAGVMCLPVAIVVCAGIAALLAGWAVAAIARRRIGGYTGDVLGAVEQLGEAAFLLMAATLMVGPG